MKTLILLTVAIAAALLAGGCASAPPLSHAKTSAAAGQFHGADHMPADALAAKQRAGQ